MEPLFEVENRLVGIKMREFHMVQLRGSLRFLYVVGGLQIAVGIWRIASIFLKYAGYRIVPLVLYSLKPFLIWILPGILWIVLGACLPRLLARRRTRMLEDDMARPYFIRFYAGEYVKQMTEEEQQTVYPMLQKIEETKSLLLLYLCDGSVDIIVKSCFTRGTPEGFLAFLRSVTNVPYKRVHM